MEQTVRNYREDLDSMNLGQLVKEAARVAEQFRQSQYLYDLQAFNAEWHRVNGQEVSK